MKTAILFSLVTIVSATQAFASCSDDADAFAAKYHVEAESKATANDEVMAPPATGDMPTVTPSLKNTDSMITAPAIPPQVAGAPGAGDGSKVIANATTNATGPEVASLVQAARAAAKQGHETDCQQRLTDAMKIVASTTK